MKVPLPRRGDKGVIIKANSVLLTFQVQHAEAPAPEVAEANNIRPAAVRAWSWRDAPNGAVTDDRRQIIRKPTDAVGQEPAQDGDRLATLLEKHQGLLTNHA
jgi:hypothetical protein